MDSLRKDGLVKMSELARLSGVPAATIKHYLREGLLPRPVLKTGRNMSYYDVAVVTRIKAIKELQKKRFLPLRVIREVLDGADPYRSEETSAALAKALDDLGDKERRTRQELLAGGMPAEQLDFFKSIGFVTPRADGDEEIYEGDDLALLRTLGAARREGISPEMLPYTVIAPYVKAIRELVRGELEMFRTGLVERVDGGDELERLVNSATKLSERLVVLLRRKLLLPVLREMIEEEQQPAKPAAKRKRGRGGRKRRKP